VHFCTPQRSAEPAKDNEFRQGDVIVTAVAHHYAVGRVKADGIMQEPLGSQQDLADA
jgi:hypothetical protein